MSNPTIEELQNNDNYELIAELNHKQIKEFVVQQLSGNGILIRGFMIYQFIMILLGLFFLTRAIVLAFQQYFEPLFFSIAAFVFCFSILIIIHELLHGFAIKLMGAKKVNYGGYLKKFIFYAEADRHVFNRSQFTFIALAPLIVVKLITITGVLLYYDQPLFYFIILVMSAHSLFCAGDIGLLSIFYKNNASEIFTFDVKNEKTSYYYLLRDKKQE